ncbi:MAG: Gfo/Idh/MocA family oxidoreductase, partial [Planctomycetota bacterium]|nr:Gfo/Idh/MocA family oxidoreductase [Planctomycetota bacterium]
MNRTLTVAVVGTGFLARTRLQCWRKVHHVTVEVVVASRDRKSAEEFAAANGADRAATIEEAFADPSVALVDLCVPNHAHAPLCEQAAAAGKHILCTKPLTAYWGQGLAEDASAAEVAATDRRR